MFQVNAHAHHTIPAHFGCDIREISRISRKISRFHWRFQDFNEDFTDFTKNFSGLQRRFPDFAKDFVRDFGKWRTPRPCRTTGRCLVEFHDSLGLSICALSERTRIRTHMQLDLVPRARHYKCTVHDRPTRRTNSLAA